MIDAGSKNLEKFQKQLDSLRASSNLTFDFQTVEDYTRQNAKTFLKIKDPESKETFIVQNIDYIANQSVLYKNREVFDLFLLNWLPMIKNDFELKSLQGSIRELISESYAVKSTKIDPAILDFIDKSKEYVENKILWLHQPGYEKKLKSGVDFNINQILQGNY